MHTKSLRHRLPTLPALVFVAFASTGCSTPGPFEAAPRSIVASIRKVVVISVVANRIDYEWPGLFKPAIGSLDISKWGMDDTIAERTSAAIQTVWQVQAVPFRRGEDRRLLEMYVRHPWRPEYGVDFKLVRSELKRILEATGAQAAVVVFNGARRLPGFDFVVRNTTVTRLGSDCSMYTTAMVALIDGTSLESVSSHHIQWGPNDGVRRILPPVGLPFDLCESELKELPADKTSLVKRAFLSRFEAPALVDTTRRLTSQPE